MRSFVQLAAAATALITAVLAAPAQIVHPGGVQSIVLDTQDTVNGTAHPNVTAPGNHDQVAGTAQLPLTFVNNFAGNVNAYVTGLNSNNQVVLLQPNGQFYVASASASQTTPQLITANVAIPVGGQGSSVSITLPGYISAARIWFAVGDLKFYVVSTGNGNTGLVEPSAVNPSDPNANVNWGFVELTNNASGIYANISYVDFVGLALGMTLTGSQGTQNVPGLQANAVSAICNALNSKGASDGQPWGDLCMESTSGAPLRILSPNDYVSSSSSAFSNYYTNYVNQVWSHYTTNTLTIDTQTSAGKVACQVSGSTLYCNGDNRGYAKPTAADIFGCNSGPFLIQSGDNAIHYAVVPRLCAAFDRSTLLLNGGNVQPSLGPSSYYTTEPTNWFSAIVHEYEIDGIGYAFSYDDVGATSTAGQSGLVSDASPSRLEIVIGGPSS